MSDVGCRMSDVGCRMSDVGCWMLDSGCRMTDVDFTQRDKGGKDRKGFDGGSRKLSGYV